MLTKQKTWLLTSGSLTLISSPVKWHHIFGVHYLENQHQLPDKTVQQHLTSSSTSTRFIPPPIFITFYRGTIDIVLTSWVWFKNYNISKPKTLYGIVRTAGRIIAWPQPPLYHSCSICNASSILGNPSLPSIIHLPLWDLEEGNEAAAQGQPGWVTATTPRLSDSSTLCCPSL